MHLPSKGHPAFGSEEVRRWNVCGSCSCSLLSRLQPCVCVRDFTFCTQTTHSHTGGQMIKTFFVIGVLCLQPRSAWLHSGENGDDVYRCFRLLTFCSLRWSSLCPNWPNTDDQARFSYTPNPTFLFRKTFNVLFKKYARIATIKSEEIALNGSFLLSDCW